MSVVVSKEDAATALETLKSFGEDAYVIGEIIKSDEGVVLC
jgi:phosphoribosylformylglycinamidine cyclo-ligase